MVGILLAAGFSRRFGHADKLLHSLADGRSIGLTSAMNLIAVVPVTIAIVRPDNSELARQLNAAGAEVIFCKKSELQMGDSLAAAIRVASVREQAKQGYIIALADMPYLQTETIRSVADTLNAGASIVVPTIKLDSDAVASAPTDTASRRGHPVAFAYRFSEELIRIQGDTGAKSVLAKYQGDITYVACDDPGMLRDIDTLTDLEII